MKKISNLLIFFILLGFLFLTTMIGRASERPGLSQVDRPGLPVEQAGNSTVTPTMTDAFQDQTVITPTLVTESINLQEPFSVSTLVFPELPATATATSYHATQTPSKGIPLAMIPSGDIPTPKSGIVIVIILFWLVLMVLSVFIARNVNQAWPE